MTLIRPIIAGCKVGTNVDIAIADDTDVNLGFNIEGWDSGGLHDTVTNNERITIPANLGGRWLFSFRVGFEANATGDRFGSITRYSSGGGVLGQVSNLILTPSLGLNSVSHAFPVTDIFNAAAGDYFIAAVKQTSTVSLDILIGTTFTCSRLSD